MFCMLHATDGHKKQDERRPKMVRCVSVAPQQRPVIEYVEVCRTLSSLILNLPLFSSVFHVVFVHQL